MIALISVSCSVQCPERYACYALRPTSVLQVAAVWLFCVSCHIARPTNDSVGVFLPKWSSDCQYMTGSPICARSDCDCAAWVSTGHLSVHTHTRVTRCFASETRDQQVLPPGVSAMHWPFPFILALRSESLHCFLTEDRDCIFVCMAAGCCVICVCVCGPNGLWLQP